MASEEIQIEIGKLLGEGGFGKVYYGQRISGAIPNQVALKSTQYNNKEDDFKKEILLLEQMDHLYVVKFYGLYVIESVTYIVMDLCEGTLKDYVAEKLTVIPKGSIDSKHIIGQMIFGLLYLHGKKIVHKDFKPENVLLWRSESGLVLIKLADFGFSRQLALDQVTLDDTTRLGTSGYIAPELWQAAVGERKPSFASDIWSLGVVIFYVISDGKHPYGDRMPRADTDIRDHLITEMNIPPNLVDFASDHWEAADLVLQMIHRNPKNRPNLINILLHPYFSLTNEALKNFFQSEIAGMHFGGSYKELTDFYSQTEIEKWYQSLDPKLKFKDIKEEKDRIQPILRNMLRARNTEFSSKLEDILMHLDLWQQKGDHKTDAMLAESQIYLQDDTLTSYIMSKLLTAAPQLITSYTWSRLQFVSPELADEAKSRLLEVKIGDLYFGMFSLSFDQFQELVNLKFPNREPDIVIVNKLFGLACFYDLPEIVNALACCGAEVDLQESDGSTALHMAVSANRSLRLVETLLDLGADPSKANALGLTALHLAAENCNVDVTRCILESCKAKDENCLSWRTAGFGSVLPSDFAYFNPNPDVFELFLSPGKSAFHQPTVFGFDPLVISVIRKDVAMIEKLIAMGANVNKVVETGISVLHLASLFNGYIKVVEVLLRNGANPNLQGILDLSPLHSAVVCANVETVKVLLTYHANPNVRLENGGTALHFVSGGQTQELSSLLSVIHEKNIHMILPFAKLTTLNVQTVVRTMSNVGLIDMIVKPTALCQAAMFADKHMEIINILFNAGADIEAMDNLGNRPLHFAAAISPSVETVKLFLELGADPTAVNSKGHTPLECAAMENANCTVFQVMWFSTISKPLHLELKVLAWLEMMRNVLCEANVR